MLVGTKWVYMDMFELRKISETRFLKFSYRMEDKFSGKLPELINFKRSVDRSKRVLLIKNCIGSMRGLHRDGYVSTAVLVFD